MFSQTLTAQLVRMTLLLVMALAAVHHSPFLLQVLAEQAMDAGCHSHDTLDHSALDSHHQHHNHHQH
ncbi:hypothetical protein [Vibrio sp. WXL103]|uniref:hypothetical protein n=1 Tax=unclassified Vibrio TaxID=2614977 RepID=UPI003EC78F9D